MSEIQRQTQHYWLISRALIDARDGVSGALVQLWYEEDILDELDTFVAMTEFAGLRLRAQHLLNWARAGFGRAVA